LEQIMTHRPGWITTDPICEKALKIASHGLIKDENQ
jgi:hypothetical protein